MLKYLFGPCLYRLFRVNEQTGKRALLRNYELSTTEWMGDSFIKSVSYALTLTYYCSPVVAWYVYQKGFLLSNGDLVYYAKVCAAILIGLGGAYILRAIGRSGSKDYQKFYEILVSAKNNPHDKRGALQLYDFAFSAWPVDFKSSPPKKIPAEDPLNENKGVLSQILSLPVNALEYVLGHGLARTLGYPGSMKLLQAAMGPALMQGRGTLIEKNATRAKLLTVDGNEIDSIFLDKRGKSANGNILVISSEGNAGFYEVGCMGTPLKADYSVLGWNHPGFMGSTGSPSPSSEQHAMEAVMQYATTRLAFQQQDIILFAWSIGGYPATYAAMMYPDVRGVILDATFDDIGELARVRMPSFASGFVDSVILKYMDLNNAKFLLKYPGPIRLIRRVREEIITTSPQVPSTNRCNYLLEKLLRFRYPNIVSEEGMEVFHSYLAVDNSREQAAILESMNYANEQALEAVFAAPHPPQFPMELGSNWSQQEKIRALLFLTRKYLSQYDATHCVPLPSAYFVLPWQHRKA